GAAQVIRGGGGGDIGLRGGGGVGGQCRGYRGGRGVGSRRGGGARGAGLRREIASGVKGGDGVRVRRGGRQARVWKGGRARRGDLGAIAEDAVAAHAYVIRGDRKGVVEGRSGDRGGRQTR